MLQQESTIKQNNTKTVNMDVSFNNTVFEKKSDFGKNSFSLRRQKYPDFRFTCPNCGTLDVLLELKHFDKLKGHCLDCKMQWNEDSKQ
jgi:hypothetical protein